MKRFRRYIFNTLTVVSLLLLLATVGLWVDSSRMLNHQYVWVGYFAESWYVQTDSSSYGILTWGRVDTRPVLPVLTPWFFDRDIHAYSTSSIRSADMVMRDCIGWRKRIVGFGAGSDSKRGLAILIPHWFLTLIFATLPAIWLYKWNKRRKLSPNACPGCGYDLTGNTTGQCPECGGVISADQASVSGK